MSLKQRAVQCSGHIPADQYVPVYSRPYRTNQARWREEISPLTPKPTLDDPYDTRTNSIHQAVKQWLESSPNSVIGPLYGTRSPSSGSPPSNGDSVEKTPARAATTEWESTMERFYDVGSGGLSPRKVSPRQVSIEQSDALVSGSSTSSPRPADRAHSRTPWENTYMNRVQDARRTDTLSATQSCGVKSPERLITQGNEESGKAYNATLPSIPQVSPEEEASAQAEEGTNGTGSGRRGGKKRNIAELASLNEDRSCDLSGGSFSDFTSRSASGEFDNALSLAVKEIDKLSTVDLPVDLLSSTSASSSAGEPLLLLKPPRGLEQKSKLTLPRASSARDDHNSAVVRLLPALPRAASAREDTENSVVTSLAPSHRAADSDKTSGWSAGEKARVNSEIVPVTDSDIGYNGFSDKENIGGGGQKPRPDEVGGSNQKSLPADVREQKKLGFRATLKKIDEARLELWSKKKTSKTSDVPRLTIKAVLQNETILGAKLGETRGDDSPVISNGVAALPGGRYEFRNERSSRRTQSSYSSAGSVASAANSVPSQYIYKVSPPHQMARHASRSKKQSAYAVAPVESHELKRDKSTKSNRSTERGRSPEKAKLEELRVRADAWENAKNATILSRYKLEESKIHAWEERKVAKATVNWSKMEHDMEKKRAKATEKMQYEVAQAHKKAAEKKARAEAKRAERVAKAAVQAQVIRVLGKSPFSCFRK